MELTNLEVTGRHGDKLWSAIRLLGAAVLVLLALGCQAHASNPRWVTGPPYFASAGVPIMWYTRTPLYYTDPGDLSQYVNHAAADALVAAAANTWNVPSADFVVAQGGALGEHVSGENSYFANTGVVFPADVQTSNYSNVQIAVIYDTDGSVTDLLLGSGASAPLECGQNGVTESVDQISTSGLIQHAVLVLNGRCTGPAPEQQLQMQYQLMRAFGRVFGVGWSQTNDNVFTQSPVPTYNQAMHWPIMHPIDIICGPYTYQCLPQPFTLRDDDVGAISQLYRLGFTEELGWGGYDQWLPGKHQTYDRAADVYGTVTFPNGQGMAGVNVEVQRLYMFNPVPEAFYDASSTTGFRYQQYAGNPVAGAASGIAQSMGTTDPWMEGWFDVGWIPMIADTEGWVDVLVTTEPVNPLYIGTHAVGPYTSATVTPSGTTTPTLVNGLFPNDPGFCALYVGITATNAVPACNAGTDGTEASPATLDATGWWNDAVCGPGHSAWSSAAIASGHTATIEVTALNESGAATDTKVQPIIGVWNASDPTGTRPTYAYASSAFNTIAAGTTAVTVAGPASGALRMVITDARGDGRPDYSYKARVLYAASVAPATTALNGTPFTVSGMGFRMGNEVLVNGVPATVSSWTANTITAVAPPASAFGSTPSGAVDVTVKDLQTGAITTISGALTYTSQGNDLLTLVSAPSGIVPAGVAVATPFAVRVVMADGVTPVQGVPVQFSSAGAPVQVSGCSGTPCLALTDATGLASVALTPTSMGDVTVTATAVGAFQSATFHSQSRTVVVPQSTVYLAAGATVSWSPTAVLSQDATSMVNVPVLWTGAGALAFTPAASTSGTNGIATVQATAGPLTAGSHAVGQVCGWTAPNAVCATLTAVGVDPAVLSVALTSGGGQSIGASGAYLPVTLEVVDPAGHPVGGAVVSIHQVLDQAQMPCAGHGACPAAAQLATSVTSAVSDINGAITIAPLQGTGATVTQIVAATGSNGFVSLSLTKTN